MILAPSVAVNLPRRFPTFWPWGRENGDAGRSLGASEALGGLNPDIAATFGQILSLGPDTVKMRGGTGRLPVGRLQSPPDAGPARAPFTHDYRERRVGYGRWIS